MNETRASGTHLLVSGAGSWSGRNPTIPMRGWAHNSYENGTV